VNRPATVYIFDDVDGQDAKGMNERVAACYAWAEAHGLRVLDEIICWVPRCRCDGAALALVVAACRRDQAALLVYSPAVLPPAADTLGDLVSLPLWSVLDASTPPNGNHQHDPLLEASGSSG
jgi:hypothetical protein